MFAAFSSFMIPNNNEVIVIPDDDDDDDDDNDDVIIISDDDGGRLTLFTHTLQFFSRCLFLVLLRSHFFQRRSISIRSLKKIAISIGFDFHTGPVSPSC